MSYHQHKDQLMAFTSQILQRYYLPHLYNISPMDLMIDFFKHHKPFVSAPAGLNCDFNVSHCFNYVAMAIYMGTDYTIGVDIEVVDPDIEVKELGAIVFSPSEMDLINNSTNSFFRLWTKKEALIKALGTGFATNFYQDTQITLDDFEQTQDYCIITRQIGNYFLSVCWHKKQG